MVQGLLGNTDSTQHSNAVCKSLKNAMQEVIYKDPDGGLYILYFTAFLGVLISGKFGY